MITQRNFGNLNETGQQMMMGHMMGQMDQMQQTLTNMQQISSNKQT